VRGRLVQDGMPVSNAEIGLVARERGFTANLALVGYPLPEVRIGTNDDGTFSIPNVPAGVDWYLYGKMEALAVRGGSPIVALATKSDGADVNLGDIPLVPAFHLRGKVVLSDGKAMPAGMRININPDRGFDSQSTVLGQDGAFEFSGLAQGGYSIFASVRGYRLKSSQFGMMPLNIATDAGDFVMTLDPR
jgi:hypothetical protein